MQPGQRLPVQLHTQAGLGGEPDGALLEGDAARGEDALALVTGAILNSLGVLFVGQAKPLTAGIAFLLHYALGISFGQAFFLLNSC